ncbi:MAG: hypothetical protein HYR66_05780 [Sphingobacteriales bacterium]|nr:hypothetical protein [Sphingobacteriales bacterium]MBI3717926.1 hypothetical protein [Sphingobacteriales bacterium]
MPDEKNKYRLDRTAFKIMTVEEADKEMRDYRDTSYKERLEVALYLTSIAYKFDMSNPPRIDRSAFQISKLNG